MKRGKKRKERKGKKEGGTRYRVTKKKEGAQCDICQKNKKKISKKGKVLAFPRKSSVIFLKGTFTLLNAIPFQSSEQGRHPHLPGGKKREGWEEPFYPAPTSSSRQCPQSANRKKRGTYGGSPRKKGGGKVKESNAGCKSDLPRVPKEKKIAQPAFSQNYSRRFISRCHCPAEDEEGGGRRRQHLTRQSAAFLYAPSSFPIFTSLILREKKNAVRWVFKGSRFGCFLGAKKNTWCPRQEEAFSK